MLIIGMLITVRTKSLSHAFESGPTALPLASYQL